METGPLKKIYKYYINTSIIDIAVILVIALAMLLAGCGRKKIQQHSFGLVYAVYCGYGIKSGITVKDAQ